MHAMVAQSALVKRPTPIRPYLIGSLLAHGLLLAFVLGYSWLRLTPTVDLNQKPIKASLVRLGKPRDEKLLPRKEELPPPPQKVEAAKEVPAPVPAPEAPKAVPVPIPGVKPSPAKAATKQDGLADGDRRSKLFNAFSKTSKQAKEEELEGQLDGDPNGDSATAEGERYFGLLSSQIHRNYDVSQTIPDQERISLKAEVFLMIGSRGEVLRSQLQKPSGNELFDNAVILAVKRAAPFSPPPDHLRHSLQNVGVVLEFRP